MGTHIPRLLAVCTLLLIVSPAVVAGSKHGFADQPGGGKGDPLIKVGASIAPDTGAQFSLRPDQANKLYRFNSKTGTFTVKTPPPVVPLHASGRNQFIRIKFPFNLTDKKVRKTILKPKGAFSGTSFLSSNITITDENGAHIPVIAVINGKIAHGTKLKNDPDFPVWLDSNGKNRLLGKDVLTLIASTGDQSLSTISAFGGSAADNQTSDIAEIDIRIHRVGGITINGHWRLKIGDGTGQPKAGPSPLLIDSITAQAPVTPAKIKGGKEVVEPFSRFIVTYSEPVVPESVGLSAKQVTAYNATNPIIGMLYSGNMTAVPNPENLSVPIYPNFVVNASPNGVSTFTVPFDVIPINPNNLSEYLVTPLIDLPGKVDVTLQSLALSQNGNPSSNPQFPIVATAATTLYNIPFVDVSSAAMRVFRVQKGSAFTNVPVSPQALYYAPLTGSGVGAINLDGNGFETNDPATKRLLLLTNAAQMATCPQGSYLFGCNKNTYGDPTGLNPIGLGGNPKQIGGPTPLPGVNEGSTGSTANGTNPNGIFPEGFETVSRNSKGGARLAKSPQVGSVGDIQVGDFLDSLFYDPSYNVLNGVHTSLVVGGSLLRNSISDPPVPNPPPLRLPVGLPPVEIVFDQQQLQQPPFIIEGDEVWPGATGSSLRRILLLPGKSGLPDRAPTFAQNGPAFATHSTPIAYAARQQIGNFLYVTDRDQGVVQVLNSNTFKVLESIKTPDPEGLGLSPDLSALYVSNFGDDTVSVVSTNPYSHTFHQEVNRVKVGSGPRSVSVQPDNEDAFICNFLGDSISILDPSSQTIRRTLSGGLKRPREIILTPRHTATGYQASVYFGFINNSGKNNVPIYESGPSGATGFGSDSIRWSSNLPASATDLRGMTYDPGTPPGVTAGLAGGVYVTHRDQDTGLPMVSRIHWTAQNPTTGAFPPVPLPSSPMTAPGILQRIFDVVGTWGGPLVPMQQRLNFSGKDQTPYDVVLSDFDSDSFFAPVTSNIRTNIGALSGVPTTAAGGVNSKHPHRVISGGWYATVASNRAYVSFPGDNRIEVLDASGSGTVLNTIENVPSVGELASYFDQ